MRKITQQAVDAFMNGREFKKDNTEVFKLYDWITLDLHGNSIAQRESLTGQIRITNAGWPTNTTKERLNGIPGVRINQKNGEWYLNGEKWNGEWVKI